MGYTLVWVGVLNEEWGFLFYLMEYDLRSYLLKKRKANHINLLFLQKSIFLDSKFSPLTM